MARSAYEWRSPGILRRFASVLLAKSGRSRRRLGLAATGRHLPVADGRFETFGATSRTDQFALKYRVRSISLTHGSTMIWNGSIATRGEQDHAAAKPEEA
jgi:hypothetical protein